MGVGRVRISSPSCELPQIVLAPEEEYGLVDTVVALVTFGMLLILTQNSVIAPFIYTLF